MFEDFLTVPCCAAWGYPSFVRDLLGQHPRQSPVVASPRAHEKPRIDSPARLAVCIDSGNEDNEAAPVGCFPVRSAVMFDVPQLAMRPADFRTQPVAC